MRKTRFDYKSLDELGYISRGRSKYRPRDAAHLYGGKYPFIQTGDIKHAGLYLTEYTQTYSEAGLAQSKLWPAGTLCITIAANIAETAILGIDACFPDSVIGFIANDELADVHYIKYLFDSQLKRQYQHYSQGVAQDNLSQEKLLSIKLPIPPLPIQRKIAAVLTALDDKIALNKRINDKLEAMAKRLYDYWFVQFDFPDENGRPYKSSGGKMVWNETLKREIPEGWEVKRLGEVCSFRNGINYDKSVLGNKKYKIINVRNITASSLFLNQNDFDEICLPSYLADGYIIHDNTVLIARSGSPGATRIINSVEADVIFCGFIICMENFDKRYKMYFAYNLKSLENTNATKTGGSILQNVSQDTLKRIFMVIPPAEIINSFNRYISTNIKECDLITKQSDELNSIRDRLLPLLMNGQVIVDGEV